MHTPENTMILGGINKKVIAEGALLPIVELKDGSRVQTGTVAAMLHNVKLYNAGERGEVESELCLAVPTLLKVGLFDLFPVEEWLSGDNAGRRFVGKAAIAYVQGQLLNQLPSMPGIHKNIEA